MISREAVSVDDVNTADDESTDDEYFYEDEVQPEYTIPQGVQELNYNPSNLTDEDEHAIHMPRELRCDGCRLAEKFKKVTEKFKHTDKQFYESDIIEMVDSVCIDKEEKFKGYGMKEINGKRRLSGEGLETKDVPGLQKGGGKWPYRLHLMCEQYAGEVGEQEMFDAWQAGQRLDDVICRNKQLGPICPKRKKKKKKKAARGGEL
nr:hypothetical protein BaRGS_005065 [Batillaria attramentaria]